jgi:hypoxanthine phosphoribosyltransferase
MEQLKLSTLISEKQIHDRIKEIGKAIGKKYKNENLTAICVLKGSFIFYSDLIRAIDADIQCEFFGVSSYHGATKSSGEVKLTLDLSRPVEGEHVLLIEDIVDTGLTMNYLIRTIEARKPKSLTTISLLLKPDALKVKTHIDHVGFEIGNEFVVGYGLDYQGYYRNLPHIAQVENMN